jgi:hypothetical protein
MNPDEWDLERHPSMQRGSNAVMAKVHSCSALRCAALLCVERCVREATERMFCIALWLWRGACARCVRR